MSQPSPSTDIRRDLVALLPRLRRFAMTLTGDASDADQLVRGAAMRAIQKSHHWKGEGRLENWLFSIMRTIWSDEARKRRKAEPAGTDAGSAPERKKTASAVLSMPEGLASAFLLTDVEGFTCQEAATILGIPADQLAARLCAARLGLSSLNAVTTERRT